MLILVGVTVSYVANGGLITKSKQAGRGMQIAADKELLEFDVILAMGTDGEISFSEFRTAATGDGFTISGSSLPCTATSRNGNEFSIGTDGKVTYIGEGEYIDSGSGSGSYDSGSGSGSGSYYDSGSGSGSGSESDSSSSSSVQGNLGKYVTYGGIEYIVMEEDTVNGTVDLISANALQVNSSNITLGYNDPGAILAVPAVDENNPTLAEQEARARWSYNNMVETLVTACKNATGLTVDGTNVISIRSVGNTNVKYTSTGITGSDNPGTYTFDWQTLGAESDWYTANGYNSSNMKAGDENYQTDLNTMQTLGIAQANNACKYWLASRCVLEYSESIGFCAHCIDSNGDDLNYNYLCYMSSVGFSNYSELSFSVRPVVTLNSSVISEYLD